MTQFSRQSIPRQRSRDRILACIVFITGAVIMVLELVGTRILAPYTGTSLYIWTTLIGIILGSLSLGYWWGGKVVDRRPEYRVLGFILLGAGIAVGLIKPLESQLMVLLVRYTSDVRATATIAGMIFFVLPSILLGMVSPFAVGLSLRDLAKKGATVGSLYALSTLGSILGTFFAGYFLIPQMGHATVLTLLATTLLVLSFLALWADDRPMKGLWVAGYLLIALALYALQHAAVLSGIVEVDTTYNRVWISEIMNENGKQIRRLSTGWGATQTAIDVHDPVSLVSPYTRFYRLIDYFVTDASRVAMIGGGGYAYPRDFLSSHTDGTIDVVEIDPGITKLARDYFFLQENQRLTIHHEDGRRFLMTANGPFNAVLLDMFSGGIDMPWHMATREAFLSMKRLLTPEGVIMMNVISSLSGKRATVLRGIIATIKTVFPKVAVFAVRGEGDTEHIQNIMVVAGSDAAKFSLTKVPNQFREYTNHLVALPDDPRAPVFTDNKSNLEYLTLAIMSYR